MAIWGPFYFKMNDEAATSYRLKIYGQPVTKSKKLNTAHVTFKYGDLVNMAIKSKQANDDESVEIAFAIYRMAKHVYIGIDREVTQTYGTVAGKDHGGSSTEKLVYSLIKAAKAEVIIRLLIQKDGEGESDCDDISDITDYLTNPENWGGEFYAKSQYLSIRHVVWGTGSDQQMHNKFMLLSHIKGEENEYKNCTYTSTANLDPWDNYVPRKEYYQTGVTVYDHELLYEKYINYFNIIWENCGNHSKFIRAILDQHDAGNLNYLNQYDPYVSAYFFPIRETSYWDQSFNPIAVMLEKLSNKPENKRYIKMNMAFLRPDFWCTFCDLMENIQGRSKIDIRIKTHDAGSTSYPNWVKTWKNWCETHTKNWQFLVYDVDGQKEHYSITGSTNAKENGYLTKANNSLIIKDSENFTQGEVYLAFREMFEDVRWKFQWPFQG